MGNIALRWSANIGFRALAINISPRWGEERQTIFFCTSEVESAVNQRKRQRHFSSLPDVFCLLLPLGLRNRVGFWRVVKLARLNDVFLVVVYAVAVDVDAHLNLMLLAVAHVAWVEGQTILAAQQGID
ncbi:MAG: hypothetical protein QOF62_645 [Pyrinomonadaceae bacterium]|nr:hypothetical protein [Pyrinomonadaceae bacterium]